MKINNIKYFAFANFQSFGSFENGKYIYKIFPVSMGDCFEILYFGLNTFVEIGICFWFFSAHKWFCIL